MNNDKRDRKRQCKGCGELIIFLPTNKGGSMPTNPENVTDEDNLFIHGHHESHFKTCTQADSFRKDKPATQGAAS